MLRLSCKLERGRKACRVWGGNAVMSVERGTSSVHLYIKQDVDTGTYRYASTSEYR